MISPLVAGTMFFYLYLQTSAGLPELQIKNRQLIDHNPPSSNIYSSLGKEDYDYGLLYDVADPNKANKTGLINFGAFDLCSIKCQRKVCTCCRVVVEPLGITACVTTYMDPNEKIIGVGIDVSSWPLYKRIWSVGWLDNVCVPIPQVKSYEIEACFGLKMKENYNDSATFRVCPKVSIVLNKKRLSTIEFNCWEYKGNLVFDSPSYLTLSLGSELFPFKLTMDVWKIASTLLL